jgi:DNA-binding GntR family transcriptional regulator
MSEQGPIMPEPFELGTWLEWYWGLRRRFPDWQAVLVALGARSDQVRARLDEVVARLELASAFERVDCLMEANFHTVTLRTAEAYRDQDPERISVAEKAFDYVVEAHKRVVLALEAGDGAAARQALDDAGKAVQSVWGLDPWTSCES